MKAQPQLSPWRTLELKWSIRVALHCAKMVGLYVPAFISHWMWITLRMAWPWVRLFSEAEAILKEMTAESYLLTTLPTGGVPSPSCGTWVPHLYGYHALSLPKEDVGRKLGFLSFSPGPVFRSRVNPAIETQSYNLILSWHSPKVPTNTRIIINVS